MFTKQMLNRYTRLVNKVYKIKADIIFLRNCKKQKVIPNFIQVKCNTNNDRTKKVIEKAERIWLQTELNYHYSCLNDLQSELYNLHLYIIKDVNDIELQSFLHHQSNTINIGKNCFSKKREIHNRKLEKLSNITDQKEDNHKKPKVKTVEDLIVNLSNVEFNSEEMDILNRGLNYTPPPNHIKLDEAVVDIESSIQYKPFEVQKRIRNQAEKIIKGRVKTKKTPEEVKSINETVKKLREKDVYYLKSDKGNKVVILNKKDYDDRMEKSIKEDGFSKLKRSPLPRMINDAKNTIKIITEEFGLNKFKFFVSNPEVPKMYGLPKVHKTGEKMRKIVSNVKSPLVKIARWLVSDMRKHGNFEGLYVKNSFEFVEKAKNIELEEDEIMISFDVEALFPSIPIPTAIKSLEQHLIKKKVDQNKINVYIKAAGTCMSHNCFVFRNEYYKNESGASMGNPLSPMISEALMTKFEMDLKAENLLPKNWCRYVDDVFATIKESEVENTLRILNSRYESINFTFEKENNKSITFLDLKLERIENRIDFSVYRKPTSTDRYITEDSFCSFQHKTAAFHSMAHRLCKLPLSIKNFQSELEYMKNLAEINGFNKSLIEKIVKKHSKQIKMNNLSTLHAQNKTLQSKNVQRVSFTYTPTITNRLMSSFERENMSIVYNNNNKLKCLLGSTKDKTPIEEKSGIYEISCSTCDAKYIGQTKRNIGTRFKEHLNCIKNRQIYKSSVAAHVFKPCDNDEPPHKVKEEFGDSVRLVKNVLFERKLDAYESLFIYKNHNTMNADNGNIISTLFSII